MAKFVQLHFLTFYHPSNLNRDDLGRPKIAIVGGQTRLRISSQSLKRCWRKSDLFGKAVEGHMGIRTKEMGVEVFNKLTNGGVDEDDATEWAKRIAGVFGKLKTNSTQIEQLAHFSVEEKQGIDELVEKCIREGEGPSNEELNLLQKEHKTVDIAMFGRMLASSPKHNTEAAVQVAHAMTVHKVDTEDDFFTAVDDLNKGEEDAGAGHLGETEFGSGLFYLYVCVDKENLIKNLSDNNELANKALGALIECASQVSPTGKQNSFASRSRASYIRCECGSQQPRALSVAFLDPINQDKEILKSAIKKLEAEADNMERAYGKCFDRSCKMEVGGEGTLEDIVQCATGD